MITWAIVWMVVKMGSGASVPIVFLIFAMGADVAIFYFISRIGKRE